VEEQFYIVTAPSCCWCRCFGQRERRSIVLALLSLGSQSGWCGRIRQGAFYLLHSPRLKLLLGTSRSARSQRQVAPAARAGILGLALIAGSVLLYRETSRSLDGGACALRRRAC
jgi:hypothetical protein